MRGDLRTQHSLPEWTATFLTERCDSLSSELLGDTRVISLATEEDTIHCWRLLLLAATETAHTALTSLEALHLLHARIIERSARGGCADIAPDVDRLARTILADQLRCLTDTALAALDPLTGAATVH